MTPNHNQQQRAFTKMHGLGNDILVVDLLEQHRLLNTDTIRALSDRHTGIGFDQLITIEQKRGEGDFFCRIFNTDGSIAEQCGNGLRCIARYLHDTNRLKTNRVMLETIAGVFPIQIKDNTHIAVSMSAPTIIDAALTLPLSDGQTIEMIALSVGNPHIITKVASIADVPLKRLGAALATHPHFPEGTNVGFMQVNNAHHVTLRTYERGVGLTLACGSNACAAVVAGIVKQWLSSPVTVQFERGDLHIAWDQHENLIMEGPADYCFSGKITL